MIRVPYFLSTKLLKNINIKKSFSFMDLIKQFNIKRFSVPSNHQFLDYSFFLQILKLLQYL